MNKSFATLIAVLILSIFFSCGRSESDSKNMARVQVLKASGDSMLIEYHQDTIIFDGTDKYFFKDNQWFGDYDSLLFMTLKDTICYKETVFRDHQYKYVCKSINSNEHIGEFNEITLENLAKQRFGESVSGIQELSKVYYDNNFTIKEFDIYWSMREYKLYD